MRKKNLVKPNADAIKDLMWASILEVRSNDMDAKKANAIAAGCRTILSTVKLEMQMRKQMGKKPIARTTNFITA